MQATTAFDQYCSGNEKEMADRQVGILGATSLAGKCLLQLLSQANWQVRAYSRSKAGQASECVEWLQYPSLTSLPQKLSTIHNWICLAPIWTLPEHFALLDAHKVQRIVVLSSTSLLAKESSSDPEERATARRLAEAEVLVQRWAEKRGVEWVILRPTLIYGLGKDKNITEIARFIKLFGFFPLFGKAHGLRQPIHVMDVASACLSALQSPSAANRTYCLSGGEILPYSEMVIRTFAALQKSPRLVRIPLAVFRFGVALVRCLPRYQNWTSAMAERMNQDLVFDHSEATKDFGFKPRGFVLTAQDLET